MQHRPYRVIPVRLFVFPMAFPAYLFRLSPFSVRFPARVAPVLRFSRIPIRLPPVFSCRTPTAIASPAWYTFGTPRIYRAAKIRTSKIRTRNGQRVRLSLPEIPYANRPGRKKGPKRIPKTRDTGFPPKERETPDAKVKNAKGFSPLSTIAHPRPQTRNRKRSSENGSLLLGSSRIYIPQSLPVEGWILKKPLPPRRVRMTEFSKPNSVSTLANAPQKTDRSYWAVAGSISRSHSP